MRISPKHGFAVERSSFICRPSDVAKSTGTVFSSARAEESEKEQRQVAVLILLACSTVGCNQDLVFPWDFILQIAIPYLLFVEKRRLF